MTLPVTVIVPVRNAEHLVDQCLTAIFRAAPQEVIVVDGKSSDRTPEIVKRYQLRFLSDNGAGLPAARMMGVEHATSEMVVLLDVDILLPDGALKELYEEFVHGHYDALQAGLISSAIGPGTGGALTVHHNRRSKNWPGVMATIFAPCSIDSPL
jgi:glycosyltransferase involved in cell wall biosynthesis